MLPVPRIMVYGSTGNIGDTIQTVALSCFFPQAAGIWRHDCWKAAQADKLFVVNGFLAGEPPVVDPNCLFAGVHIGRSLEQHKLWFRQSPYPVGARDPWTHSTLEHAGLQSELIGCATMTFPRYDGARAGVYAVDTAGPGRKLTHDWPSANLGKSWEHALELLSLYQTAKEVHTSRLHVALPCLAFGTPVCFVPSARGSLPSPRFTLLTHLGLKFGKTMSIDISDAATAYVSFLSRCLGSPVVRDHPKMPSVIAREGPSTSMNKVRGHQMIEARNLRRFEGDQ